MPEMAYFSTFLGGFEPPAFRLGENPTVGHRSPSVFTGVQESHIFSTFFRVPSRSVFTGVVRFSPVYQISFFARAINNAAVVSSLISFSRSCLSSAVTAVSFFVSAVDRFFSSSSGSFCF